MRRRTAFGALATTALLGAAALATPSYATSTTTTAQTAACTVNAGSVTAAGAQTSFGVTATKPPSKGSVSSEPEIFPAGKVRLSSAFFRVPNISGVDVSGYVVEGDSLYSRSYNSAEGDSSSGRIGGGWTNFTALEIATYMDRSLDGPYHQYAYGLRSDGTLFRWNLVKGWKTPGSATGFSSVKTMALISKTATYDTFLATTKGGALYTIRIPITAPMKPVLKKVRTSGWQSFDALVPAKCGKNGTLLLGIDKETKTGTLFAVGHANGAATVIQNLGKVTGTFPDAVHFRWGADPDVDQLLGE
jgi:hypothetical protein